MSYPSSDWIQKTLEAHNEIRRRHGAPALRWSEECFQAARRQAGDCQARGALFHRGQQGPSGHHGQNCFASSVAGADAPDVVQMWYSESSRYDFLRPGYTPGTGHFTQVVWAGTTHVGMAMSMDGRFVVANYFPAGNVCSPGLFEQNVRPASLQASPTAQPWRPAASPVRVQSPVRPTVVASGPQPAEAEAAKPRGCCLPFCKPRRLGETPAPASGKVLLGASSSSPRAGGSAGKPRLVTVKATGMTREVLAALEGVPSPRARAEVQQGLSEGATVTIERQEWSIAVRSERAGATKQWKMTWG